MCKRFFFNLIVLLLGIWIAGCNSTSAPQPTVHLASPTEDPTITLTMASWRSDDVEQMSRIFAKFNEHYPNIKIVYDTGYQPDYDTPLLAQLQSGTGPDLIYLRSFDDSRALFEQGFLETLSDLPGLSENFTPAMQSAWATDEGVPYGVPYIATSHGVYYNVDLFNELGLDVPTSWESFLSTAQTIQEAGYIPIANSSGSKWAMAELVFMNLAPNFIGGREGRLAYLSGERCLNDDHVVAAFQAIKDIAPFLPPNHSGLKNLDSVQLFAQGKAAMMLDGSWDIHLIEAQSPTFAWGVFAPPPPHNQPAYLTFHQDVGMGLNAASPHKAEARKFLEWMTTAEFAELLGNELPGFYPMHTNPPTLSNDHANSFLALNQGRGLDVRFVWDKLMANSPNAYILVMDGTIAVANGEQSPQEAADALQSNLEQWFEPAQNCK
ncbi:ABC transporter substrate-binding protein [Anaerolineales bacterium HSG25]|nr:ABC transporter substrate-binding protein [Anaerolineales bacterium HSG25]